MSSLFAMPYLMAIVTDYAYPPEENVALLNELKREHICYELDCSFGTYDSRYETSFIEWWFWKHQATYDEPNTENLHFPFAWSDYDSDYKEQWWDQHEDTQNPVIRQWPGWMDSDAFEKPEDLAFRFWDLNKH